MLAAAPDRFGQLEPVRIYFRLMVSAAKAAERPELTNYVRDVLKEALAILRDKSQLKNVAHSEAVTLARAMRRRPQLKEVITEADAETEIAPDIASRLLREMDAAFAA